jgi:hypothetical protein
MERNLLGFVGTLSLFCLTFFVFGGLLKAYAVEVYSKEDSPFGLSLDQWLNRWWTWWVPLTNEQSTPINGGCLMNKTNSMVFLMETTSPPNTQRCEISSTQGIMLPMWTAFMEASGPNSGKTYQELSKIAREEADLGQVTSLVKVDGKPIAKLDEVSSMKDNLLDYKINSMENVTELFSKGFNITIPEDSHYVDQNAGTWHSGAHGWFVPLKPLSPGNHTINYNVHVTGSGPETSTEITYLLKVK